MRRLLLTFVLCLSGQVAEEPTIRVTTGNVLLDVVVTDRKGNPIRDLQPSDFRVTQSGSVRPVVAAALVQLPRREGAVAGGGRGGGGGGGRASGGAERGAGGAADDCDCGG